MKVTIIAGARPNFIKIAPIISALKRAQGVGESIAYRLVHTGQHYDAKMSQTFFEDLNIPSPDVNLECGGGTQAEQTASIMIAFEKELIVHKTDLVLVVGDVTSTMACSIVAKKMNVKLAHVEAGIRSWDRSMPEEINRVVTDSLADYYFTTTRWAGNNLIEAGVRREQVFFVGNVMIDTLLGNQKSLKTPKIWDELNLIPLNYFVLTLHRPTNVDDYDKLKVLIYEVVKNVKGLPIIFPVHPRTAKIFNELGINYPMLHATEPLGYLEFIYLIKYAKGVITDSGGITEETTVMGVPCITLRDSTERPETVDIGTNELIGTDPTAITPAMDSLWEGNWKKGEIPEFWDGNAAERIVEILLKIN